MKTNENRKKMPQIFDINFVKKLCTYLNYLSISIKRLFAGFLEFKI